MLFDQGCLDFYNDVSIVGAGKLFSFASAGVLTICKGAQLYIDSDVVFKYDSVAGFDKFIFEDATSRMVLQNARLQAGSLGLSLMRGTIIISGVSLLEATSRDVGCGLKIGVDMDIKVQVGATLDLGGTVVYG